MNSKLLVRVLMGIVGLLVVVGLVINFTPALSTLRGQGSSNSPVALTVNGLPVTEQDLANIKGSNPVLSLAEGGLLGDDIKTYVTDRAVTQALVKADSQNIKVSRGEVNDQVDKIRAQYNLTDSKAWLAALAQAKISDAEFRSQTHDNLQIQGRVKQITDAAPKPTDAQLQMYYQLHQDEYQTDPRVRARLISVADQAKAKSLLAQLKGGADFAQLASANSLDYKDRGGAVAAVTGGKVTPVTEAALQPAEVGAAAFALTKGGLSDVIKSGNKYYIVKVEEYLPAGTRPYADVKADVTKKVTELLGQQAQQNWVEGLQKNAKVEVKEPQWAYQNPAVAVVDGTPIHNSELIAQVLSNQSLGQLLQQAPPEQAAGYINGLFKPQILQQLIQSYAASAVVARDKLPIVGPRPNQLADLESYGTRDLKVTDADVQAYYTANKAKYQTPASGNVDVIAFTDKASALAFRQKFPADPAQIVPQAAQLGGTLTEYGQLKQGETDPQTNQPKLNPVLDKAVFAAGRLQSAAEGSVSDVVEAGGLFYLAYVRDLVPASVTPLAQIEPQVRQAALTEKQTEARSAYLEKAIKDVKIENKLAQVLAEQAARVQAASATSSNSTASASSAGTSSSAASTAATSGASTK